MSNDFEYLENDEVGMETLRVISAADKFNKWMYQTIRPYCQGNILEVGSGIGNISEMFLQEGATLTCSDIRQHYCDYLKKKLGAHQNLKDVFVLDLVHPEFEKEYSQYLGTFDAVFALNVIEHIKEHETAIANCGKLLKKGGKLAILVPAYQSLYNQFDKELYHFRRYTKKTLKAIFDPATFSIAHKQYFNLMGVPGWYVSGKMQKNKSIPGGQMKLYNTLVPVFKLIDKVTFNSMGLSVVVVGEKK